MKLNSKSSSVVLLLGFIFNCHLHLVEGQDDSIRTLTGHDWGVFSVAVTPDGSKIVSGSQDNTIKIWNLSDGALIRTLTGHTYWIHSVAVTPDGSKIVSGSQDETIKIWNLSDGALIRTLTGAGYVTSVAVSPDCSKIVSGSYQEIKIWNFYDGNLIRTLTYYTGYYYFYVHGVAITPDGSKIISGSGWPDNKINIWNLSDGTLIRTLTGHDWGIYKVTVTPDGSKIVSGSETTTVKIWNLSDGALIRTLIGHTREVYSVAVTLDGSKIVSGSRDGTIKIWNLSDGALICTLTGHTGEVYSVFFTPDGSNIVSGGGYPDNTIKIWGISDLTPQSQSQPHQQSYSKSPAIRPVDWFYKKKSEMFGYEVEIYNDIAVISVPFCITHNIPGDCSGGFILTYKMSETSGLWIAHNQIKNPFLNRDNMFGFNMLLNANYLIVSAPKSKYINTEIGIVVLYTWNAVKDAFVKDSVIRYRKTSKNFQLGAAISNINNLVAIGMPVYDHSGAVTNAGCALIYKKKENEKWGMRVTITAPNPKLNGHFGQSVSLESVTKLAVSNNPEIVTDQAVYVYEFKDGKWKFSQTITNGNKLGFGWAIEFNANILYVSAVNDGSTATNAGSILSYTLNSDGKYAFAFTIEPNTVVAGKHFGFSFSFSTDGDRLAVGAKPCANGQACNIKGSMHLFTKSGDNWRENYYVESPAADGSDAYGFDVDVEGSNILVSAPYDSNAPQKGKVYFIKK